MQAEPAKYPLLLQLVQRERDDFQQVDNRWRPRDLLMTTQIRATIRDMEGRYERVSGAEDEFSLLDHRDLYLKMVRRMRLNLRAAMFSWKADQLRFLKAVAEFYVDFGTILRLLKFDVLRGLLS